MSLHGFTSRFLPSPDPIFGPRPTRPFFDPFDPCFVGGIDVCGLVIPFLPRGGPGQPAPPPVGPTTGRGVTFPVQACLPGEEAAFVNGKPCCPSGMHFSKSKGCCVKNRRMNVFNMKAHSRATRRILGNARAQKRARKAVGMAAREMGACPRPSRRQKPCK